MIWVGLKNDLRLLWFLNGLNKDIASILELQHYIDLQEMIHMAIKIKRQLKSRGTAGEVVSAIQLNQR